MCEVDGNKPVFAIFGLSVCADDGELDGFARGEEGVTEICGDGQDNLEHRVGSACLDFRRPAKPYVVHDGFPGGKPGTMNFDQVSLEH